MKALVLVAHGSRRNASNDEVRALSKELSESLEGAFDFVNAGFLELAEPSIPDAILDSIKEGAQDVVVLPYFLSAGRHVVEDVPAEVDKVREVRPDVNIDIRNHVGGMPGLVSLLCEAALKP